MLGSVVGLRPAGLLQLGHWNDQVVFNLRRIHLDLFVARHPLLPLIFEVEEHVLACLLARAAGLALALNIVVKIRVQGTYLVELLTLCVSGLSEPGLKLLIKLPILFLQLDRSHILLWGALLVIKCKEKSFQVKLREIFLPCVHRHRGVLVVSLRHVCWLLRINDFLIPGLWRI